MILALAARLGCLALAVADRLKPRDDAAFDAHVAATIAAPEPVCTCADALWTDAELVEYAPLLAELDGVTTYDDFVYAIGGDA